MNTLSEQETVGISLGGWRPWLALAMRAVGYALGISSVLMALVALAAGAAQAQTLHDSSPTAAPSSFVAATTAAAGTGDGSPAPAARTLARPVDAALAGADAFDGAALLFRTEQGPLAAPLQSSRVRLRIAGNAVRARIVQRFENPGSEWRDAVYQFPLPEDAAVDALSLKIGERLITGEIREKQAARRTYDQARQSGRRAAMVSQQRPNMFTADVANIGPGDMIEIVIEYQQALGLRDTGWTLRLPTVIAPRYETVPDDGAVHTGLPQPPTILDRDPRANRLMLELDLMPGLPVTRPESPSHAIMVSDQALPSAGGPLTPHGYRVSFTGEALADRDFVLNWRPLPASEPEPTLQLETHEGQAYGLLTVAPADSLAQDARQAREIVFVIDTSGSMHGDSIAQAKAALTFALERLHADDRFNIIRFNDRYETLFPDSRAADARHLARARRFVSSLQADGGTEMRAALERALLPAIPAGMLSQVVFITDGAVGNEAALFGIVDNLLGQRRLYTVGIGSSPNSYFMRQAAVAGRGSFTMIEAGHRVEATMARLFRQLGEPVLTNLRLRDEHGEIVATRDPLRDLHAGDPILTALQFESPPAALTLEGERGGRPWQREIAIVQAADVGVHKLWARAELERLGAALRREHDDAERRESLRGEAVAALRHGLVSAYTSLVAVDHTPVRPADQLPQPQVAVPRHLPAGWDAAKVFRREQHTHGAGRHRQRCLGASAGGLDTVADREAPSCRGVLCRAQDLFDR
ncbi:MAG: marine proteobacterial sortase target protein [Burkholderiaceae bacterium]